MTTCPKCGRENVAQHEGHLARCGRRVTYNDAPVIIFPAPDQWRERMAMAQMCQPPAETRPMKSYWLSWFHTEQLGPFELHFPWWHSGTRLSDDAATICAAVRADNEEHAKRLIMDAYDRPSRQLEWRFVGERLADWTPFNGRFPKAAWMKWHTG